MQRVQEASFEPENQESVVKGDWLSHGTLECYSLKKSRYFYEKFLGLECVHHAKPAMAVRCGMKFHIVCVEVGNKLHPASVLNHWGIDVGSLSEVDRIWQAAKDRKEEFGIRQVQDKVKQHGVYSFYLEDLDHNWWEFQYYDGVQHEDMFDFGDRFDMDEDTESASLKELEIENSK